MSDVPLEKRVEMLRDRLLRELRDMQFRGGELGLKLERILQESKNYNQKATGSKSTMIQGPPCSACGKPMRQVRNVKLSSRGVRRRTFTCWDCEVTKSLLEPL